jgi:predicted transglutaminase-like cysteine proteinase
MNGKPDMGKLELVNEFYNNRILYASDIEVWGVKDYWATPDELLERNSGDCEDIAIAKYFTLKESGMGDNKLRIIYGRLVTTGEAHIVLCYCESLILDNRVDAIMTVPDRSDFVQIVGFNCSGVWTFKRGVPRFTTSNSKRILKWRDLQERMNGRI